MARPFQSTFYMANLPDDILIRVLGYAMSLCKSGHERYKQALKFLLTWHRWKVGKI